MTNSETNNTAAEPRNSSNGISSFFMFPLRHPLISVIIAALCAFSAISFLAHFNASVAQRFNQSASQLGFTTLSSVATNRFQKKAAAYEKQATRLASIQKNLQTSKASIQKIGNENRNKIRIEVRDQVRNEMEKKIQSVIKNKDAVIDRQKIRIDNQSTKIANQKELIIKKDARLKAIDEKRKSLRLKKEYYE